MDNISKYIIYVTFALVMILAVLLIYEGNRTRKKSNPKVSREIVCNQKTYFVTGRRNKFYIRCDKYEFYVSNGQIVGFRSLTRSDSSIAYYGGEKHEGF